MTSEYGGDITPPYHPECPSDVKPGEELRIYTAPQTYHRQRQIKALQKTQDTLTKIVKELGGD